MIAGRSVQGSMDITPFQIHISGEQIDDLHERLHRTRWPRAIDEGWGDGTSLPFARRLVDYWRTGFDWRSQEERLNRLPQFTAVVDGLRIHFIHYRGKGTSPFPLILTHGWPGSFVEMEKIIPLLNDPASHGGNPGDSFDVVVPSLPGFGFSQQPEFAGIGPFQIAGLWAELMKGLGYARYGAQGGDWGSSVSTWLAYRFPQEVAGVHLNFIPGSYRPPLSPGEAQITAEEQKFLDAAAEWGASEGAYSQIQGTKPLTLAYGLTDSPAGLAAWVAEKFCAWSDCDGDVERAFTLDELLTNIAIYWFTETIGSSVRLYREGRQRPVHFAAGERVRPPLGVAEFPRELPMPPRSWLERVFDVRRWTQMPRGGHFAAMEAPQDLAVEIREFFRPLRGN